MTEDPRLTICTLLATAAQVYPHQSICEIICLATQQYTECAIDLLHDRELLHALRAYVRASGKTLG